ncbi:MAG: RadC family protein, partial [Planctomycetota bacterium]
LATRTWGELRGTPGIGGAQASRLVALFALAKRIMGERLRAGEQFANPRQIFDHYHAVLRDKKREMFLVVLLDARHRILREEVVSEGSLTSSIVHPRDVFAPAVRESAGAVVLVHNHPSGDPRPSDEDVAVTRRLVHASELLGIRVLDHVIVGDGAYASFKEAGLL